DPKLTMAVYGRAQLHDLGAAVGRLPSSHTSPTNESQAVAKTGTDAAPVCTGFVQTSDPGRDHLRLVEAQTDGEPGNDFGPKSLPEQGVEADCDRLIVDESSAPRRTRTYNPLIKSQLLCQLS